ncbi:PepSY-like domain-containing protein [Siphonobacter sp.]|uniref:PepSY-like domain-containing protein n=1 Tax=Siphonobacter sp. TaxID=1869184 RepID=UPI003B3BE349
MKKTFVSGAILLTLLTASCTKTAMTPSPTQTTGNSVLFSTRTSASVVGLPSSTLPTAIQTYLDQNAAGYTLIRVEKKAQPGTNTYWGTKVTVLKDGVPVDYYFDTNGALTTRPASPRGEALTSLAATQLPATVSSYLSQTYAGYQFIVAESVQINGVAQEYRVQIVANGQRINVHFDGTGTFRDAHTAPGDLTKTHAVRYLSRDKVPAAIETALTSTYTSYTYGWTEEHVHDETTTYDVKVFSNGQLLVLHFDTTGTQVIPTGPGPKPGGPGGPMAPAKDALIQDATLLPSVITTYLQTHFSGYTFLVAKQHTPPAGTTSEYKIDVAVGEQLYTLRFSASGELLMAHARG